MESPTDPEPVEPPQPSGRSERHALLMIWAIIAVIGFLVWCFADSTFGMSMMLGAVIQGLLFDTLIRAACHEKRSLLDWIVILPFKGFGVILAFLCRHPLGLPLFVLVTGVLSTQPLQGVENVCAVLAALFGLVWILILWVQFLGWLSSLTGQS